MPRPFNEDLSIPWKINLPATLAGRVEYALLDPVHNKPIYASRNRLIVSLLEYWLAKQSGTPQAQLPHIPSILELRERRS
jgi:hypothetical protein